MVKVADNWEPQQVASLPRYLNPTLKDKILNIEAKKPFRRWTKNSQYSQLCAVVDDVRTLTVTGKLTSMLVNIRRLEESFRRPEPRQPPK